MKKIISMWSPSSGSGVTLAALTLAKELLESGRKVILLDFDLLMPSLALYCNENDPVHGLDNLLPFLESGAISSQNINSNLQTFLDVPYVRGTNAPERAGYIKVEALNILLSHLSQEYDHIILDTFSDLNNPGTYVALSRADTVLALVEKNVVVIQHLERLKTLMQSHFDLNKFQVVLTRCRKGVYLEPEVVTNHLQMPVIAELPEIHPELYNAINQARLDDFMASKHMQEYRNAIRSLIGFEGAPAKSGFKLFRRR